VISFGIIQIRYCVRGWALVPTHPYILHILCAPVYCNIFLKAPGVIAPRFVCWWILLYSYLNLPFINPHQVNYYVKTFDALFRNYLHL